MPLPHPVDTSETETISSVAITDLNGFMGQVALRVVYREPSHLVIFCWHSIARAHVRPNVWIDLVFDRVDASVDHH